MKAAIAGYSGLTGSFLTQIVSADPKFEKVILIGRKDPAVGSGKFEIYKVPFEHVAELKTDTVDSGFCVLGTTIKKAGSKENFRKVDYEYVLDFAKFCKSRGAKSFHLMSSVGANAGSSNFYLRTKGEVENAVRDLGFESLYIYRPSMLFGPREEFRLGELIGKAFMKVANVLLVGSFRKYKGIYVRTVAFAMVKDSQEKRTGVYIRYYDDMT